MIFSHADICFEKMGFQEQTMVYVRELSLAQQQGRGNSIRTRYSSLS
jgi:hypothetical protein